jgi:uridine kinase
MWMMQIGVKRNEELKIKEKPLLIGIGGDSSTGKHTTFNTLKMLIGENACIPVFGDNFHKWERDNQNWKVFTHLNPMSNKLHKELELAVALREGDQIELIEYDHTKGKFINPKIVEASKFIFFIGLHPFYLKSMRDLIDIKIFMEVDEDLRRFWKIKRDVAERGYEKSKVIEQIDSRLEDNKKFIQPQKDFTDLIIKFTPLEKIDQNDLSISTIPFKVIYKLDNSVNLDNLINDLSKIKSLSTQLFPLDDLIHQEVCIEGSISFQDIANIAHNLELNFDELSIGNPSWQSDFAGITQLMFLIIYNHKMKAK